MSRLILPIILILAALGLFVVYTNPTYQASKAIAAEVSAYDEALTKSKELIALRDQLISKRNTFSPTDVAKLSKMLPDNVDNIRLIIDINNIAVRHNLSLTNVQLGDISDSRTARNAFSGGGSGDAVGSVTVGFGLNATYDQMLEFLQDIEHSLRIIDVQNLGFSSAGSGTNSYSFTIRTYWLH
jgi:Tfp pilus assembly protein PilO